MSGGYRVGFDECATVFEVSRLRRTSHELWGELTVRTSLPGAKAVDGVLVSGDFNFSSVRARQERAKIIAERARASGVDWFAILEEFCQGVFKRERDGAPAVDLRTIEKPSREELQLDGLPVPRRHPAILFGDGGTGKSLLALWWAGVLVHRHNMKVVLFDWELSGEDHRERLEQLFGANMPRIEYCRCELPLYQDSERILKIAKETKADYAVFDSVAIACDGPPESAESAARYFRALRPLSIGTLHIAHVNKSEHADKRPFGSAFWHNLARSTWYIESEERDGEENELRVALYNRKSNLGKISRPVSYLVRFAGERVTVGHADISDSAQLASKQSARQQMRDIIYKHGPKTAEELAEWTGAPLETIKRYSRSRSDRKASFVLLAGGKIGIETA